MLFCYSGQFGIKSNAGKTGRSVSQILNSSRLSRLPGPLLRLGKPYHVKNPFFSVFEAVVGCFSSTAKNDISPVIVK